MKVLLIALIAAITYAQTENDKYVHVGIGACRDHNGVEPQLCVNTISDPLQSGCQSLCTGREDCTGYEINSVEKWCVFYVCSSHCPDGWTFKNPGGIITEGPQTVISDQTEWSCYRRESLSSSCTGTKQPSAECEGRSIGSVNCYGNKDRNTCLTSTDPRKGTNFYHEPCVWKEDGFSSGNKCEPLNWAEDNAADGSYDNCLNTNQVKSGDTIYLLSTNTNTYIDVDGEEVKAEWDDRGAMQTLKIFKSGASDGTGISSGDMVFLKSVNTGKFIDVTSDGVKARYDDMGDWQQLTINTDSGTGPVHFGEEIYIFSKQDKKYIDITNDGVQARYLDKGDWQRLKVMQPEPKDKVMPGSSYCDASPNHDCYPSTNGFPKCCYDNTKCPEQKQKCEASTSSGKKFDMEQGLCPTGFWEVPADSRKKEDWACCSNCPGGVKECYSDCGCACSKAEYCEDIQRKKDGCFEQLGCEWVDNKCVTLTQGLDEDKITMPQGECKVGFWEVPANDRQKEDWECCKGCPGGETECYSDCGCACSKAEHCEDITRERDGCFATIGCKWHDNKCVTMSPDNDKNILVPNPGVDWGGSCTCPDGQVYLVSDNDDACGSLACIGGISGECHKEAGPWSQLKVICAGAKEVKTTTTVHTTTTSTPTKLPTTAPSTGVTSKYQNFPGGRCRSLDGSTPKYQYLADKGDQCEEKCDDRSDCYGYSTSEYDNCLLWLQQDIQGGGGKWGDTSCHIKDLSSGNQGICFNMQGPGNGKCQDTNGEWAQDLWGKGRPGVDSWKNKVNCLERKEGNDGYCGTQSKWCYAPTGLPDSCVEGLTEDKNLLIPNPGIDFGGTCTCPDGQVYQVSDNNDDCGSLACVGGVSGKCHKQAGPWSQLKVICAGHQECAGIKDIWAPSWGKDPSKSCSQWWNTKYWHGDTKGVQGANKDCKNCGNWARSQCAATCCANCGPVVSTTTKPGTTTTTSTPTKMPTEAPTFTPRPFNFVEKNPGKFWGGECICPDGAVYQVSDNSDACGSLACFNGGISGECNKFAGPWSERSVVCTQMGAKPLSVFGPKEEGSCVTSGGNSKAIKAKGFGTEELGEPDCLVWCIKQEGLAGCEFVWGKPNAGCYGYKGEVGEISKVKEQDNHICWFAIPQPGKGKGNKVSKLYQVIGSPVNEYAVFILAIFGIGTTIYLAGNGMRKMCCESEFQKIEDIEEI